MSMSMLAEGVGAPAGPVEFASTGDAGKAGCQFVTLKGKHAANCILQRREAHSLLLFVYDATRSRKWVRSERLELSSWYGKARVSFVDLFRNGGHFMSVDFEGNTGTGVLQMLNVLIGWNGRAFEAASLEIASDSHQSMGNESELRMTNTIQPGKAPSLTLVYRYLTKTSEHGEKAAVTRWQETLAWNPKTFSFYAPDQEERVARTGPPLRRAIALSRLAFLKNKPDLSHMEVGYLQANGIMEVMPAQ